MGVPNVLPCNAIRARDTDAAYTTAVRRITRAGGGVIPRSQSITARVQRLPVPRLEARTQARTAGDSRLAGLDVKALRSAFGAPACLVRPPHVRARFGNGMQRCASDCRVILATRSNYIRCRSPSVTHRTRVGQKLLGTCNGGRPLITRYVRALIREWIGECAPILA
jgi:hypothetical protein